MQSESMRPEPDQPGSERSSSGQPASLRFAIDAQMTLRADGWGDSSQQPVLFLHGGGQTRHAWHGTASALAGRGWYAVCLDLRGHGESSWAADGNYTSDAFVADVTQVVAQLGAKPVIVGASLGGITAMLGVGEGHFPPCAAVILVDIAPRMEIAGVKRIRDFMRAHPCGFASVEAAADAVAAYRRHRRRPKDVRGLLKNLRLRADGRYYWHWDPAFMVRDAVDREGFERRCQRAVAAATVPLMLVRGGSSDVVSEEGVRDFLRLAPTARFVDIQEAGHMVAGDRNDVFTKAVLEFIDDLPTT